MRSIADPIHTYVRERIRQIRISKRIASGLAARRAGLRSDSYCGLENGYYRIRLDALFRILFALDASLEEVWPFQLPGESPQIDGDYLSRVGRESRERLPRPITAERLLQAVCQVCEVSLDLLRAKLRGPHLTKAQHLAVLVADEIPHLTWVQLARALNRDPSSLMHTRRRARAIAASDPEVETRLLAIHRLLRSQVSAPNAPDQPHQSSDEPGESRNA